MNWLDKVNQQVKNQIKCEKGGFSQNSTFLRGLAVFWNCTFN